jgi:hypothetical protein
MEHHCKSKTINGSPCSRICEGRYCWQHGKSPVRKSPVRKSPVRKSPVRKSPVRKSPVRKSPVRKSPVRKSPVRKSPSPKYTQSYLPLDVMANEIALNSDIKTLRRLCKTNKQLLNNCESSNFWIRKFQHDNLPIFKTHKTMEEWTDEYEKVSDAQWEIKHLKLSKNKTIYVFDPLCKFSELKKAFPQIDFEKKKIIDMDFRWWEGAWRLAVDYNSSNSDELILTQDELMKGLFVLYYLGHKIIEWKKPVFK